MTTTAATPAIPEADAAARTSATILSGGVPGQRRIATELIAWTLPDQPTPSTPPQWLDGTPEGRRTAAETLCQHTAPEDREAVATVLTGLLRRAITKGATPPGHAGAELTRQITRHLSVISLEMADGMTVGGPAGAEKLEHALRELLAMHRLLRHFPRHGQCGGEARVMELVELAWQVEAENLPHQPAVRREPEPGEDDREREQIPLQGFKQISLNASDLDGIWSGLNQIAGSMIMDRETAAAVALGVSAKRPNRDSTLLVQPYLILESPDGITEDRLARNVAAINCGIRYAAPISPRISHQEFIDA